jgi:hypothetical protein
MPEEIEEIDNDRELRAASDRIETLLGELAALSPVVRDRAEELVRLLMRFYGGGLERIVSIVGEAGPEAGPIFARLAADDLVATLLVLHDLHPAALPKLVQIGRHGGASTARGSA